MIWLGVTVRGVREVNDAVVESHRAAEVLATCIKWNDATASLRRTSREAGIYQNWAAKFCRTRFQVQCIKVLLISRVGLLLDFGNDIQRAAGYIDDRSGRDAEFDLNIAGSNITLGNWYCARGEQRSMPKRDAILRSGIIVRVESVDTAVFSCNVDDIVTRTIRKLSERCRTHIERLPVALTIQCLGKEESKTTWGADVRRGKNRLVKIGSRVLQIGLPGRDVDLPNRGDSGQNE